ncbi:Putative general stress protein 26 [Fulvivirga imtechensis AK7]|uniref:Putative general stress protein 26 n=1 Tax=Fulvivirga imtechensis AK7 TaxID=1237149 RepID=L8K020_9BACT|nr:pyridoxamine 5'-phosphate oxidase family protein [Fulvivirga imtechensis]ELR73733.1 Putative general stress protein 26 [Fulvivirga imtechensis AK7]
MENTQDLDHNEAMIKLRELIDDIDTCMLVTDLDTKPLKVRPMHTLDTDSEGNIWFFTTKNSSQYTDIHEDRDVQLIYSHPGKTEFLSVYGTAEISEDRTKIEELWTPMANTWFKGKDDPNLALLRVSPEDAYYWDTKTNKLVSLVKIAASSVTGMSADDGRKGKLNL